MTALEYLTALDKNEGTSWTDDDEAICQALDQFAQIKNAEYIEALRELKEQNEDLKNTLTDIWGCFEGIGRPNIDYINRVLGETVKKYKA